MVSNGFDHQDGLVPCRVNFFAQCYAQNRMIVKTFNSEIAEQPAFGVMLVKNLTKPVYQKIGKARALNFNAYLKAGHNAFWLHNQMEQRARGIFKHLRQRGTESFKPNVRGMFENAKTWHGIVGQGTTGKFLFAMPALGRPHTTFLSKS